jgi:hypothetical protein
VSPKSRCLQRAIISAGSATGRMVEGAVLRCSMWLASRFRSVQACDCWGRFDVNCLAAAGAVRPECATTERLPVGGRVTVLGGCRLNETARVDACAIQVLQPRRQARQERIVDQVRYQLGEQFRPLLILRRVVGVESPVESVPGPRQKTLSLRPSWPQVGSFDLPARQT